MMRIRIAYAKTHPLRYTSNLDMQKIWERTLRRASLPIAYSQGFHPQPRLVQACPLPLGFTSQAEIIDLWLESDLSIAEVQTALQRSLPPGITLKTVEAVDLRSPSLTNQVLAAVYVAELPAHVHDETLAERIQLLLAAQTLPRQRRGKHYDLRPLVLDICLIQSNNNHPLRLQMTLVARPSATGRPEEVLDALEIDPFSSRIERIRLLLEEHNVHQKPEHPL
ncbi:MAG: DUF2344 domain-containing protein [Anaerolineae bacterium]|nr:DUF2344 domain-containing protein [Anaerolineae bacterium]